MKRAVICVENPHTIMDQLPQYSLMVLNPKALPERNQYLLDNADWSLLITDQGEQVRSGGEYANERLFWYTSGTTGDSKFCSFSQQQIDIMTQRVTKVYDITANDRLVNVMPLWHAHGQAWHWVAKYAKFEIQYLSVQQIRNVEKYSPTFVSAIPHIVKLMTQYKMKDLRFVRSASAALPAEVYHNLKQHFGVPVIEAFGMTETLSQCFTNPLYGQQKIGTIGYPDGVEARITDGRLELRGPTVCESGWFDTGDLASVDDDGYYTILGRSIDRINIKGYKFDPVSLEKQLSEQVEDLGDVVIFGQQTINCLYTGTAQAQEIKQALKKIHNYCKWDMIVQVDSIPVGASGKISRSWLRQKYNCQ